jgi:hypothetical protein
LGLDFSLCQKTALKKLLQRLDFGRMRLPRLLGLHFHTSYLVQEYKMKF